MVSSRNHALWGYRRSGRYVFKKEFLGAHPLRLGRELVKEIPKENDAFHEWKSNHENGLDSLLKLHLKRSKERLIPAKFEILNSPVTASKLDDTTEDIAVQEHLSDLRWIWSDFAPERLEGFNDIKWTYILDFDRDAFTINSVVHFRLSNIPENWLSYINFDHTAQQCMPKSLEPVHLAWDVFPAIPVVEQELLQRYNESLVTVVDPPDRSEHLKTWIMLVMEMELTNRCSTEFKEQWKEWTPSDRSMQKWVFAIVKCAMWDGLNFEHSPIGPEWDETEKGLNVLLEGVTTPEATEYLVPVGTEKVLISLATHLEVEDIAKAAIGKVVNFTPDGTCQIACIISPRETIIVIIDKTSPRCSVKHTKSLAFQDPLLLGFNALIATLSTPYSRLDKTPPNGNLPVGIMEEIFKYLIRKVPDGFKTLPSLACTCKMFSAMARDRTFYLPGRLFYNHPPTPMPNLFWGWDVRGGPAELYPIGPFDFGDLEMMREYNVFVDGANLRLSKLILAPFVFRKFESAIESLKVA